MENILQDGEYSQHAGAADAALNQDGEHSPQSHSDRPSATAVAASLARWSQAGAPAPRGRRRGAMLIGAAAGALPRGHDRCGDYDCDDRVVVPAHPAAPLGAGAPQHGPAAQVGEREKCAQDLDSRPASEASTAASAACQQEVRRALRAVSEMAAARRVPEVGEEALADLVVGILHENNGNMCACRAGQNLYNLDPAYKPLLKRIGGIKGLCSRHSERLQYVGNDGGGVVRLGSGEIYVSPKQQIREEHQVPLLPAIVEGGAGLDPELDRPSGAATDAPAANQNIGAQDTPAHTPVAWAGGGGAGGEGVAAGARGGAGRDFA